MSDAKPDCRLATKHSGDLKTAPRRGWRWANNLSALLLIAVAGCRFAARDDRCLLDDLAAYRQGVVNVQEFGAVGDGRADDTRAIQKALDFAHSQRMPIRVNTMRGWSTGAGEAAAPMVFFPPGTYRISNTLVGHRETSLRGIGKAAIVQTDSEKDLYYQHGAFRSSIENLEFHGGKTQVRIWTANQNSARIIIARCRFVDAAAEAIVCRSYSFDADRSDLRKVKPVAPYVVEKKDDGIYELTMRDPDQLLGWANSTLMVVEHSKIEHCRLAFDIRCDGLIVKNCRIVAHPETAGAIMRLTVKAEITGLSCHAPATTMPQLWFEHHGGVFLLRDSEFTSQQGMCLVRWLGKPGYEPRSLTIMGCKVNSAGCREQAMVSLAAIPNCLFLLGNRETSGNASQAVAWEMTPSDEEFAQQRYFKHLDIADQFNFCLARNCDNLDPQLPTTARRFVRPDLPAAFLPEITATQDEIAAATNFNPKVKHIIWAEDYGLHADGASDDAPSLQAAVDAAAQHAESAVLLPGKIIRLANSVALPPEIMLIGIGNTFFHGPGDIPALVAADSRRQVFRNLNFVDFSCALDLAAPAARPAQILVAQCAFYDCHQEAIRCLAARDGKENQLSLMVRNSIFISRTALKTNAAHSMIANVWLQNNYLMDQQAYIENHGGAMLVESMLGVPQSHLGKVFKNHLSGEEKAWDQGAGTRWFDNHGRLMIISPRFGGESGGTCPAYNLTEGASVFIQGGQLSMNPQINPTLQPCFAYFAAPPRMAAFMALGHIPGPGRRWVWMTAPECGPILPKTFFISGPGIGIAASPAETVKP